MYRVIDQTGQGFKAHDRTVFSQCAALGPAACTCVRARFGGRGAGGNGVNTVKAHSIHGGYERKKHATPGFSATQTRPIRHGRTRGLTLLHKSGAGLRAATVAHALGESCSMSCRAGRSVSSRWQVARARRRSRHREPPDCPARARAPCAAPAGLRGVTDESGAPAARARSGAGRLQVGVAVELALVEALERLALGERHAPVADRTLAVARQRRI